MEPFFETQEFFAEYDQTIGEVPDSILAIPAVANIAPVCWAADADLYIDTIDARFSEALRTVRKVMTDMYSVLETTAKMWVRDQPRRSTDTSKSGGSGVLFSGGVDSVATLVRH